MTIWIVYVHTRDGRRSAMGAFSAEEMANNYIERVERPFDENTISAAEMFGVTLSKESMKVIHPGERLL